MKIADELNLYCTKCNAKLEFESLLNVPTHTIRTKPICIKCFDKLEDIKQLEDTIENIKKVLKRS